MLAIVLTLDMGRIIKFYRNENGRCPVEEFLEDLDDKTLAKVLAIFKVIETQDRIPSQYFSKLSGYDLWECRIGFAGQIYRFLGFWGNGALVILTHGFEKKTQKTPQKEIKKALECKAIWERRS
jgi:phage-related protein